jgi:outer membrane immunogenic protein
MRNTKLAALAATSLLALTTYASSADFFARPIHRVPALAPVAFSWTGFYVGGHLGAGWGTKEWDATSMSLPAFPPAVPLAGADVSGATSVNGFLGGVQGGYNYQVGWAVLGVEAQWSGSNLRGHSSCFGVVQAGTGLAASGNDTCSDTVRSLGTVAGRLGFSTDRTMFYVKGGWGWANDRYSLHGTWLVNPIAGTVSYTYADITDTRWGGMLGTGIEHALDGNWSVKIEYDYLDLGTKNYTFAGGFVEPGFASAATFSTDIRQNIHLVKFGINYRFGSLAAPFVTK